MADPFGIFGEPDQSAAVDLQHSLELKMIARDALKTLHAAILDAIHGYEEAAKDAETAALSSVFEDMITLHEQHHAELHAALKAGGQEPSDEGTFMSTVHRTVIGVRAAITGLRGGALDAFADGEERLLKDYDKAVEGAAAESQTAAMLKRQRGQIVEKIAALKAMAAEER